MERRGGRMKGEEESGGGEEIRCKQARDGFFIRWRSIGLIRAWLGQFLWVPVFKKTDTCNILGVGSLGNRYL
jgi:hypothetical protein